MNSALDAYIIIGMSRERCAKIENKEQLDEILKKKFEEKIKVLDEYLNKKDCDYKTKIARETDKEKIFASYDRIKDESCRINYNKELDLDKKRRIEERNNKYLKNRFDHSSKYNSKIILDAPNGFKRKNINGLNNIVYDDNNNQIIIKKTGEILYVTCLGVLSDIGEYEVTKNINGNDRNFKVYSNIIMYDMSLDKDRNPIVDKEYYSCVISRLLSDEALIGNCKYNQGYLGQIIKDNQGNYIVDYSNIEELSAVYKYTNYIEKENSKDRSN